MTGLRALGIASMLVATAHAQSDSTALIGDPGLDTVTASIPGVGQRYASYERRFAQLNVRAFQPGGAGGLEAAVAFARDCQIRAYRAFRDASDSPVGVVVAEVDCASLSQMVRVTATANHLELSTDERSPPVLVETRAFESPTWTVLPWSP